MEKDTRWSPGDYLCEQSETVPSFALIILNQPIVDKEIFTRLWNNAKLRVCADGGANHLHSFRINGDIPIPNCITGDLDSLSPDAADYYRSRGVSIVLDESQYATDFTKSLNWIYAQERDESTSTSSTGSLENSNYEVTSPGSASSYFDIVAYGATGGRVDQTFHSINQLFSSNEQPVHGPRRDRKVTLVSDQNFTFLLRPGRNVILSPLRLFGKTCGIIPVAGPAVMTTRGLEWDLEDTETKFGGMVSTSNHLVKEEVEITTTEALLFTMEIRRT